MAERGGARARGRKQAEDRGQRHAGAWSGGMWWRGRARDARADSQTGKQGSHYQLQVQLPHDHCCCRSPYCHHWKRMDPRSLSAVPRSASVRPRPTGRRLVCFLAQMGYQPRLGSSNSVCVCCLAHRCRSVVFLFPLDLAQMHCVSIYRLIWGIVAICTHVWFPTLIPWPILMSCFVDVFFTCGGPGLSFLLGCVVISRTC